MDVEDVMNFVVEHRAPNVVPGYVSEQLLSLGWLIVPEDVARITEVARRWLKSDDPFRAAVAIGLEHETYLFESWHELAEEAARLKRDFPSTAADVDAWLKRSKDSYERRATGFFNTDLR